MQVRDKRFLWLPAAKTHTQRMSEKVQQQQPQQKFKFWRDGNSGSQCYLGIHGNQPPSSATEEGWKWRGEGETAGDGGGREGGGRRCFAQIRRRRGRRKREEKKNRYQKTAGAAHPSSRPFPLPIPNLPGLEFTNKSANSFTLSVFKSDLKVRTFLSLFQSTFGEFYPPSSSHLSILLLLLLPVCVLYLIREI